MPVLELSYDPAWAAVRIVVDGGMWTSPVDAIGMTRTAPGQPEMPVRGVEHISAVGGYFIGSDGEMPLGVSVQYTVTGYYLGSVVASESASVTTGAAPDNTVWIKVPGRPDLSSNVQIHAISEVLSPTLGGTYQPAAGGPAIAQWGGIGARQFTATVQTWGRIQRSSLLRTLNSGRTLLFQTYDDADMPSDWYFVGRPSEINPFQVGIDHTDIRRFTLPLVQTPMPAGVGVPATGVSWETVGQQYETWQDVTDNVDTWFDLAKGA